MAEENEALFEESSQGAVSAVTAVMFVLSFLLSMGGLVVMSYGFTGNLDPTAELLTFSGGLAMSVIGFALPFNILPSTGK